MGGCHLWAASLLTVLIIFDCNHGNEATSTVQDIKEVESIMNDLEYIETVENAQGGKADQGPDMDTIMARLDTCKALLETKTSIEPTADYVAIVNESLHLWSDCEAAWSWYVASSEWNFETNINNETQQKLNEVVVEVSGYSLRLSEIARGFKDDARYSSLTADAQRQLRLIAMGTTPKQEVDQKKLTAVQTELQDIYSKATVNGLPMEPNITDKMARSRDADELEALWVGWRDVTGKLMKEKYAYFVEYLNIGATDNGYHDYGQAWLDEQFDNVVDIKTVAETLWQEVEPLYKQLHAYVRDKLAKRYTQYSAIYGLGGIPSHLTGNMWAQQWNNIYDIVKPYPEIDEPDYDKAMQEQGFTVDRLFELAEDFYTSIGLFPMTAIFKQHSMKVRPADRDVVCHASASDFYRANDFRIKMCTKVNTEYFDVIHHEMGHIEYFMAYKDQPTVYRTGANSGFHEAIGDTIGLSVMTEKHMKEIGLGENTSPTVTKSSDGLSVDDKRQINFLMKVALSKIAFLPFGYLIDKWRWDVFDGTVDITSFNRHWWDLRIKYQGIFPPVHRTEEDFDPGAKFHIPSNSPYICYFVSFILQFQFYEAMCNASGQLDNNEPLHTCDFYRSVEAGTLLKNMMAFGKSKPWNETLYTMTGRYDISTDSIKKYFQPLESWLLKKNSGTSIGWFDDSQSTSSGKNPKYPSKFQDYVPSVPGTYLNSGMKHTRKSSITNEPGQTIRDSSNSKKNNEDDEKEYALLSMLLDLFGEES